PPYDFKDVDGRPEGYSVDLMTAVAREIGMDIEFRSSPGQDLVPNLEAGKVDIVALVAYSDERAKSIDYSEPHIVAYDGIFIRDSETQIRSERDLAGKTLIVLAGDVAEPFIRARPEIKSMLIAQSAYEAMGRLSAGEGDAFIGPLVVGLKVMETAGYPHVRLADFPNIFWYKRETGFAVRKGNAELLQRLNHGLRAVKASGEYEKIYQKWFSRLDPVAIALREERERLIVGFTIAAAGLLFISGIALAFRREVGRKTESLAESEGRYRGLVDNLPGVVYRCANDENWTMEFISDHITDITGYTAADFVQNRVRSYGSVIYPDDRAHVQQVVLAAIASKAPFTLDYRMLHKDGSIRFVHENGVPLFDDNGNVRFLEGVVFDVSERKRISELLASQQAKLVSSARMSALGEMAGGIAHEINNPLAIINGRANQLQELAVAGNVDSKVAARIASSIEVTVSRISKIVRSLRHVARDTEFDPYELIPVAQMIEETLELSEQKMKHHGVELRVIQETPDANVECRPVQIIQILINLINNAYDAVMERPADKWIEVRVREFTKDSENWVDISVADSGGGVPDELLDRVFLPFFTTKGVGRGTGLGLSISKSLAEDHRGQLFLDRQAREIEGRTRFVLRLPVRQRIESEPHPAHSS
ncbi:MAG: transporter substrate-binding domain-containing protein, partial [Bdellovibrionaceae bacterium]|nr:transporter substrate-binding domain-containing protein [Pseudobdellovibrionaceae bacterium]